MLNNTDAFAAVLNTQILSELIDLFERWRCERMRLIFASRRTRARDTQCRAGNTADVLAPFLAKYRDGHSSAAI